MLSRFSLEAENLAAGNSKIVSRFESDEDSDNKGSMWDLDQKLGQLMDEEAGRLKNILLSKLTKSPYGKKIKGYQRPGKGDHHRDMERGWEKDG
ncbi:Potassium transporter [Stylosanthes scabra]|uniref:Potassium transporter n=1 Tax=Stylosanthes scabra TaxID=79078 RepID=A0ABU6UB67_9FABA|nr:Potassium transporter [Stylosanthes scabra]